MRKDEPTQTLNSFLALTCLFAGSCIGQSPLWNAPLKLGLVNFCLLIYTGDISTLNGSSLKLVDKFTYLGSSVSSTKADINTHLAKAWTAINRLLVIWKSDLTDKMKCSFFQAVVILILLYGCTTWMLTKHMEKKLDGNYTRMLWAIFNKSWKQHPTKQQLYGHLPPIMKTIKIRWTGHAGHCWRSREKLISDVLLWTPSHDWAKAGQPAQTYIQQLCVDMGCSPEDLPEAMDNREGWQERVRDICADGATWRWWYIRDSYSTVRLYLIASHHQLSEKHDSSAPFHLLCKEQKHPLLPAPHVIFWPLAPA